jgi:hypothetical protein
MNWRTVSRVKNQRIFSTDPEYLKNLKDEYENYVGRYCELDLKAGCLTVFARTPTKPKKKSEKAERDKRKEKFERRES